MTGLGIAFCTTILPIYLYFDGISINSDIWRILFRTYGKLTNKKFIEKQSKKILKKYTDKTENTIPPKKPSQDLLGDVLGMILFFPNFDPIIYAKESKTQVRTKRIRIGEESNFFSG